MQLYNPSLTHSGFNSAGYGPMQGGGSPLTRMMGMAGLGDSASLSPETTEEGCGQGGGQQQAMQMMELGLVLGLLMGAMSGSQGQCGMNQSPFGSMLNQMLGGGGNQGGCCPFSPFGQGGQSYGPGQGGQSYGPGPGGTCQGGGPNSPLSGQDSGAYDSEIQQAASQNGLDPNLIKAVIKQESGFNPRATSSCGAQGLMQLMPGTASQLGCSNAYNPSDNIMAGAKYLRQLLDKFHGNTQLAVAAYNAGPGAVQKYGGIPPYAETQNYVQKVMGNYNSYTQSA